MSVTILGSRYRRRGAVTASDAYLHYDADTGVTVLGQPIDVVGNAGVFARASTSDSEDSEGNTSTVAANVLAFSLVDGELVALVRPADGGRAVESLHFAFYAGLPSHSGYLRFAVADLAPTASILHWGDTANASTAAWALATAGDATNWYEVAWSVDEDGIITISAAADDGAFVVGTPSVANAAVDTAVEPELWLGGRGTLSVAGIGLSVAKIVPSVLTGAELREVF